MNTRLAACMLSIVLGTISVSGLPASGGPLTAAAPGQTPSGTSRSVWDGVYSEAQARRGRNAYGQACASCHRDDLSGDGPASGLVDEIFDTRWGGRTVGDLFTAIRNDMPQDNPASLSADTYGDIVAFILKANKFPAGAQDLSADAESLKQIRLTRQRP